MKFNSFQSLLDSGVVEDLVDDAAAAVLVSFTVVELSLASE